MPVRFNLPPLTRALIIANISLSLIAGFIRYRTWVGREGETSQGTTAEDGKTPSSSLSGHDAAAITLQYITVVPAFSLWSPWAFITASFVEQNIFTLFVTLATFFYGGKYLERAWGSAEFAKFIAICCVLPNLLTFAVYLFWFAITRNSERSMTIICGGIALQAGFLVAFKQLVPEHTVTLFKGMVKIRVKHFPAVFLVANMLSGPIFGTDVAAILSFMGFMTSWTYLRFFKQSFPDLTTTQSPSLRGDASETFAFAHFFPDPLHTPIAIISNIIYSFLISIRVCTPFSDADVQAGNIRAAQTSGEGLSGMFGAGGGASAGRMSAARAEAERRRALALKALDQRLHAATSRGGPSSGAPAAPSAPVVPNATNGQEVLGGTNLSTSS